VRFATDITSSIYHDANAVSITTGDPIFKIEIIPLTGIIRDALSCRSIFEYGSAIEAILAFCGNYLVTLMARNAWNLLTTMRTFHIDFLMRFIKNARIPPSLNERALLFFWESSISVY
jgi:hypothetical protein